MPKIITTLVIKDENIFPMSALGEKTIGQIVDDIILNIYRGQLSIVPTNLNNLSIDFTDEEQELLRKQYADFVPSKKVR